MDYSIANLYCETNQNFDVTLTSQTQFLFQDNYYDQIDGVAMGSPLAPLLANFFMGFHEKHWIEHYQGSPPLLYR